MASYIAKCSKSTMENNLNSWPTESNQQRQMFPSNQGTNTILDTYAEQCLLGDQTFPKNEPPSSFFHFSPSVDHNNRFLNYDHELLSGQFTQFPRPLAAANAITLAACEGVNKTTASTKGSVKEMATSSTAQNLLASEKSSSPCPKAAGKKRGSNRERHSKIITKQGLRDRRMRLSVDVAHKFFGLQDMLGFDKASKTVGWLLRKSKAAIEELTRNLPQSKGCKSDSTRGEYSTSESSEDMSGVDETVVDVEQQEKGLKQKSLVASSKGKRTRSLQKAAYCPVARESRAIARAKARERTMEKMTRRLEKSKQFSKGSAQDSTQLRPLSPLGSAEDSSSHISHDKKSLDAGIEINEPHRSGIATFGNHQQGMSTSGLVAFNSSDMMNFFPENWDMDSTRTRSSCCDIANIHLFADF